MQAKQRDSPLWKAICKEWFHVIKGISWAIGNGENASSSKMSGWMSLALQLDMRLQHVCGRNGFQQQSVEMEYFCTSFADAYYDDSFKLSRSKYGTK